jgi:hypothetical protein
LGEAGASHGMTRTFFFISIILGLFPHWFDLSHNVRNCSYLASQLSAASPRFCPQKSGIESLSDVDRQTCSVLISMILNRDFCTAENCVAGVNLFRQKVPVKMYISEYIAVVCWSLGKKLHRVALQY